MLRRAAGFAARLGLVGGSEVIPELIESLKNGDHGTHFNEAVGFLLRVTEKPGSLLKTINNTQSLISFLKNDSVKRFVIASKLFPLIPITSKHLLGADTFMSDSVKLKKQSMYIS